MGQVLISRTLLILSGIGAVLAIVAVGLGVYFGTRGTNCPAQMCTTAPLTTTANSSSASPTSTVLPITSTAPPKTTAKPLDPEAYRLPTTLTPVEYRLTIQPFLELATFDGSVEIDFVCEEATNAIVLNYNRITLLSYNLSDSSNSIGEIQLDNVTQKVTFPLTKSLEVGKSYTIAISYNGELADDLAGFYRGKYVEYGETKYMAMTQFEPEDARRALPCFDEPSFKAVFNLTIIHPSHMVAIANAMENNTVPHHSQANLSVTQFNPTLKMSSYLLAFAVAEFVNQTYYANTTKHTMFRIWSRPSLFNQTDYAARMGPQVLAYYETEFGVEFPLEKQDMLAAPEFSAGAMENWGLVTYREYDLLYDQVNYGPAQERNVALVMAHELAHQWFGDLVTLAWWDDLWLNEGFAAYNEYDGANNINPSFQMDKDFVVEEFQGTMQIDQLTTSHPIYMPELKTSDEINANFDTITYDKGASILYMLRNTITIETFLSGLNAYLEKHKYGNAVHEDLWDSLTQAVANSSSVIDWNGQPLNVSAYMDPWILTTGFPVVTVERTSDSLTLSQKRFLLLPNETLSHQSNWPIHVVTQSLDGKFNMAWLVGNKNLTIKLDDSSTTIIVNYNVSGFYRVCYDSQSWDHISSTLLANPEAFSVDNRAQFIDDSMNLARAKYIPYSLPFRLICYLRRGETEKSPWVAALTNLKYISTMLYANGTSHIAMAKFARSLLKDLYADLGWIEEETPDYQRSSLRATVLSTMCEQLRFPDCTRQAADSFASFYRACSNASTSSGCDNPIKPNLRAVVYCAGVSVSDTEVWENLWEKYKVEPIANERQNLMSGLACATDTSLLTQLLNELLNGTYIAAMDSKTFFAALTNNPISNLLIWDFIEDNWDRIRDRFTHGYLSFTSFVRAATNSFNTPIGLAKVTSFVAQHADELGTGKSAFDNAIENIQANIAWMSDNADVITSLLLNNQC